MGKYSLEEIEKIVETELKKGKNLREISEIVCICPNSVSKIKKQLIDKGLITEEEIKLAKAEKDKKAFLEDLITQKILKYVKAGLSQEDIARLVNRAQGVVNRRILLLKQYGIIMQEEIDAARKDYIEETKNDNLIKDVVLEKLKQGKFIHDIASILGLSDRTVKRIQDSLIAEGKITQEEIDEALRNSGTKAKRDSMVIELLRQGYSYEEIGEEVGCGVTTVKRIKAKAIADGKLNEEEYKKAKKQRKDILKKQPTRKEENAEKDKLIIEMLKAGKPIKYIVRKSGLAIGKLNEIIEELIEAGMITKEEIEQAREGNEKEVERKILEGLKMGYSQRKIVEMFEEGEISQTGIGKKIKKLIDKGEITLEEIESYKCKAEKKEKHRQVKVKRQAQVEAAKEREKDRKQLDKRLIELLLKGYSLKKIAEELQCSERTIRTNVKRLKDEGKISQEELEMARRNRRQIEKKDKRKIEETENKKKRAEATERQRVEKAYKEKLKKAQKILKSDTEVPDESVNELVEKLISLASARVASGKTNNDEIETIKRLLFEGTEQMDVNNVLGIAKLYIMLRNYHAATYILNYSKSFFEKEEDIQKINKALLVLAQYKRKFEADQMLKRNCSFEEIQKRTGLSIVEILGIKNRNTKLKEGQETTGNGEFPDL